MYSVDFMAPDKPNFMWKGKNAFLDMDCIIENELPEIMPEKRYETLSVAGRNGELHETFDDYAAYDYPINGIVCHSSFGRHVNSYRMGIYRL